MSGRFIYDNSSRAVKERTDALHEWLTGIEPGERRPESVRNDIGLGRGHDRQIEAFVDDESSLRSGAPIPDQPPTSRRFAIAPSRSSRGRPVSLSMSLRGEPVNRRTHERPES